MKSWITSEPIAMIFCLIIHGAVGIMSFLAFKDEDFNSNDKDNVLQLFGPKYIPIMICRIAYSLSILLTFPAQMIAARNSARLMINYYCEKPLNSKLTTKSFLITTIILWFISCGIGILSIFTGISKVLAIAGLLFGSYVGFVIPASTYLVVFRNQTNLSKDISKGTTLDAIKTKDRFNLDTISAVVILICGILLMTFGTAFTIYKTIQSTTK